jgi:hypothetical protein
VKQPYAASTLSRKYKATGIDPAVISTLKEYLTACANFYYVLEIPEAKKIAAIAVPGDLFDTLLPILARDGSLPFYIEESRELYDDGPDDLFLIQKSFLLKENEDFKEKDAKALFDNPEQYDGPPPLVEDWEIFYQLDKERAGKELFIPPDLLKYADEDYYEVTPQTEAMLRFILSLPFSTVDGLSKQEAAKEALWDIIDIINDVSIPMTQDTQRGLDTLESYGFNLQGMPGIQRLIGLYTDLSNHTRMPSNKGKRPVDMRATNSGTPPQLSFGPGLQKAIQNGQLDADELKNAFSSHPDVAADLQQNLVSEVDRTLQPGEEKWVGGTLIKGAKIRPNDPCPCGSGKKYKKCCGKKN